MKQRRKVKAKGKGKAGEAARLKARRLGEKTQAKAFTLPESVLEEIRKAAAIYGSQGRALQVGSELLVRMRKHLRLAALKAPMVRMVADPLPHCARNLLSSDGFN